MAYTRGDTLLPPCVHGEWFTGGRASLASHVRVSSHARLAQVCEARLAHTFASLAHTFLRASQTHLRASLLVYSGGAGDCRLVCRRGHEGLAWGKLERQAATSAFSFTFNTRSSLLTSLRGGHYINNAPPPLPRQAPWRMGMAMGPRCGPPVARTLQSSRSPSCIIK